MQSAVSEQLRQQQTVEQELHHANQELDLMNAENQHLVEAKRLFLEETKRSVATPKCHSTDFEAQGLRTKEWSNDFA